MESVPLYTNHSSNSSLPRDQNQMLDDELEGGFSSDEYEIECGTPPGEDTPNVYFNFEATSSSEETEELTAATIRLHLLEHMSRRFGRHQLLDGIENKKTAQDNLRDTFADASKQEINIAFLWTAFMKRWDLLDGFIMLGADLNYFEPSHGLSALHLVCFSGCIPGTQFLITQGCNVNAIYKSYAPLHCAAFGDSPDVAMILLNNGARIQTLTNTASNSQESVLHCAVRANAIACVRLFTHEGGDVGQVEYSGMSPVHLAADLGRSQCLKVLLEAKGRNINAKTKGREQTPLHLAAENGYVECVDILLEKGADPNLRNHMSQTPLHLAARAKAYQCVEILLSKGNANPNFDDCDKRSPLHTAVGRTSVSSDIIEILIKYGAYVNKLDQYGYTPLHIAALNELSQCVEILIQHGADVTTKSKCGMTPLGIIRRKMPASLDVITRKLDSAITLFQHPKSSSREADLRLDFKCILQHSHPREISYLNTFIDEGQKELLLHPLCEAFLYLKWEKIRKYYIGRMFFSSIFVLSLSLYVLTALAHNCYNQGQRTDIPVNYPDNVKNRTDNAINFTSIATNYTDNVTNTTDDATNLTDDLMDLMDSDDGMELMEFCEKNSVLGPMLRANPFVIEMQWYVLVGITCFEIIRKIYGLAGYSTVKQYLSYPENTLEWLVIVSVFVISFIYTGKTYMWQNHVGAFAVLFGWTNLMLMVGQLPVFGLYVAMYTKVQGEFAKLLLAYSCLLIGFAVSFCIIFPESSTFANPFISLVTVLVMMSGELSLDILVDEDPYDPPLYLEVSAQVTFSLFVLFITIVLMNLLVGIAVDDIKGLKKTARLSKLVRQTKLISHIELALFNGHLPQYFLNLLHWTALVSPKAYRVVLNVKPLNQREKRLPRDILEAAHKVALRNKYSKQLKSMNKLDEKRDSLDYTISLSQFQSHMEKRDDQIEQLRLEIVDLKNSFRMYQNTFERLVNNLTQSRC